jgi:hypothetical protein
MNGFAAAAAVLALPTLLIATAATQTSVLVVDVALEDGPRVVAPVPYVVARAGLALAPREMRRIQVPEFAEYVDDLRRVLEILEDAPDGVFVEIDGPSEHVRISKRTDAIRVTVVDGDQTRIELTLPLASLTSIHDAYDRETETLHTGALVRALRRAPRGSLLHVVDGETEVHIRAW